MGLRASEFRGHARGRIIYFGFLIHPGFPEKKQRGPDIREAAPTMSGQVGLTLLELARSVPKGREVSACLLCLIHRGSETGPTKVHAYSTSLRTLFGAIQAQAPYP